MFLESSATLFSNIKFFSLSLTILNYFTDLFQIELFSGKHHFISMHLKRGSLKHWLALCSALQLWAALCGPPLQAQRHTLQAQCLGILRTVHGIQGTGHGVGVGGGGESACSRRDAGELCHCSPGFLATCRKQEPWIPRQVSAILGT